MFLIIDNYDSFVFNLCDYVHQLGHKTHIILNDTVTLSEIERLNPQGIFISPGPKHPKDILNVIQIIQKYASTIPIFGICLGHQAIGYAFGANIEKTKPVHGYCSNITHNNDVIFKNIPQNIPVGRYHSLAVMNNDLPECLEVTARTDDNIIMAVKHKTYPTFGVQFHPESVLTPNGLTIIQNFTDYCG